MSVDHTESTGYRGLRGPPLVYSMHLSTVSYTDVHPLNLVLHSHLTGASTFFPCCPHTPHPPPSGLSASSFPPLLV